MGAAVVKGGGRNEIGGWWVMEIGWIDGLLDCSIDTLFRNGFDAFTDRPLSNTTSFLLRPLFRST